MAQYFSRIELKGYPTAEEYTKLHAAMKTAGFLQTALHSDGKTYVMPHAFYCAESSENLDTMNGKAVKAAKSVQEDVIVVTIASSGWTGWVAPLKAT